jgi:hypothetical protein
MHSVLAVLGFRAFPEYVPVEPGSARSGLLVTDAFGATRRYLPVSSLAVGADVIPSYANSSRDREYRRVRRGR